MSTYDSKEALFEAIVEEECPLQAEQVFALDADDHRIETVLTRLGCALVRFLSRPAGLSPIRTVISISERMPNPTGVFAQLLGGFRWDDFNSSVRATEALINAAMRSFAA